MTQYDMYMFTQEKFPVNLKDLFDARISYKVDITLK